MSDQGGLAQFMTLSYTEPAVQSAYNLGLAGLGAGATSGTSTGAWGGLSTQTATLKQDAQMRHILNQVQAAKPAQGAPKAMARLIRYTVADPDHILADKSPEFCILMSGTVMLNGADDKGFLMDLAPKVAERLEAHNAARTRVEYEDEEGRTKTLKPVKLSHLDVVVEVLKSY